MLCQAAGNGSLRMDGSLGPIAFEMDERIAKIEKMAVKGISGI